MCLESKGGILSLSKSRIIAFWISELRQLSNGKSLYIFQIITNFCLHQKFLSFFTDETGNSVRHSTSENVRVFHILLCLLLEMRYQRRLVAVFLLESRNCLKYFAPGYYQWLARDYLVSTYFILRWHTMISSHVLPIRVVPGIFSVEKDSRFWSFFKRKESQHWLVTMSTEGRERNIGMIFTNITPSSHLHIIFNNVPVLYPHPSLLLLKLGDFTDAWFFFHFSTSTPMFVINKAFLKFLSPFSFFQT